MREIGEIHWRFYYNFLQQSLPLLTHNTRVAGDGSHVRRRRTFRKQDVLVRNQTVGTVEGGARETPDYRRRARSKVQHGTTNGKMGRKSCALVCVCIP